MNSNVEDLVGQILLALQQECSALLKFDLELLD